jgi:hypothetical protein
MEEFKEELRKLVSYTLSPDCREDEDVVEFYFQAFLGACEEYKNLK